MSLRYFERKAHSRLYQKHMIREPGELQKLILSYLKEKKGRPYELAVDVGCGTGQSTRVLASYFQKVVGIDISEAQIQEAENCPCIPNVSYRVAAAEHLPFEDSSVDLITASVAAHWFNSEEFFREADRVLKPNGCLAMYCLNPHYDLYYKDCSNFLTDVFMEAIEFLISDHGSEKIALMKSEYQELFTDVPFADKSRVRRYLAAGTDLQLRSAVLRARLSSLRFPFQVTGGNGVLDGLDFFNKEGVQLGTQGLRGSDAQVLLQASPETQACSCLSFASLLLHSRGLSSQHQEALVRNPAPEGSHSPQTLQRSLPSFPRTPIALRLQGSKTLAALWPRTVACPCSSLRPLRRR
ncbi:uncharacterized protein LOC144767607 isoform X1 [Lissotriton helveticus]